MTDTPQPGTIEITKLNANGAKQTGTPYTLQYAESATGPWKNVAPYAETDKGVIKGKSASVDANGSITTGNDGKATFTRLLSDGTVFYRVVEIHTADGLQLLKDPIYVGTLPRVADSNSAITAYDTNGDGAVTDADVTLLNQKLSNPSVILAAGSGDVNADGQYTFEDAALIQDFVSNYVDLQPYDINGDKLVDDVNLTIQRHNPT